MIKIKKMIIKIKPAQAVKILILLIIETIMYFLPKEIHIKKKNKKIQVIIQIHIKIISQAQIQFQHQIQILKLVKN